MNTKNKAMFKEDIVRQWRRAIQRAGLMTPEIDQMLTGARLAALDVNTDRKLLLWGFLFPIFQNNHKIRKLELVV